MKNFLTLLLFAVLGMSAAIASSGVKNRANSGADYEMSMNSILDAIKNIDNSNINWDIPGVLQIVADDINNAAGTNYDAQDVYDMIVNGEYVVMTVGEYERTYGTKVKNFAYYKSSAEFAVDTDPSHQNPDQRILVLKPKDLKLAYAFLKEGCANLQEGYGWDSGPAITSDSESEYTVGDASASAEANASADVNVDVYVHQDEEEYSVYDGGNSGGYWDQGCGCYQYPQTQFSAFVGFGGWGYYPPAPPQPQIIYVDGGSDGDVYVDNDIDITITGGEEDDPPVVDDGGPVDGGDPGDDGGPVDGGDPGDDGGPIDGGDGDGRLTAENSWGKEVNNLQTQKNQPAGKKTYQTAQNVPETDNLSGKKDLSYSKPTVSNNQGGQTIKVVKRWSAGAAESGAGKNQTPDQNGQVKTNTASNSQNRNTGVNNPDYWWNKGQYASNTASNSRNGNTNNNNQSGRNNYSYSGPKNTGGRNQYQYNGAGNRPTGNSGGHRPGPGSGGIGRPTGGMRPPGGMSRGR